MNYKTDLLQLEKLPFTFSIVLETENLGMAGLEDLKATLQSLLDQTYPITHAQEVLVLVSGHVLPETIEMLQQEYPWLTIHNESHKLEYLESKMRGCELAHGEIVVMVDSDAIYHPRWLEETLYGFIAAPGASIVCSETRIAITSLYTAAIQLSWMINANLVANHPTPIVQFHLNNFAIRKQAALTTPLFVGSPIYRANNTEWKKQLQYLGYSAVRVPGILAHHAPPGNFGDWWYRMLISGADAVAKADFYYLYGGEVVERFSPLRRIMRVPAFVLFKLYKMITRISALSRENKKNISYIIIALLPALFFLVIQTLGAVITVFNRNYLFEKITTRENSHVV